MEIDFLTKLDLTLIVSAITFYLVLNYFGPKLSSAAQNVILCVSFILAIAAVMLSLWQFEAEISSEAISHSMKELETTFT